MDLAISRWIVQTFGESKVFAEIAKIFSFIGSKWIIIGLLILLLFFKRTRKLGIYSIIAVAIAFAINDFILKIIIARDRPFIADPSLSQIANLVGYKLDDGYSMPSGHSVVSMAFAIMCIIHSRKIGIPAVIVAVLVGISRICLCVHYLTDVLAGFAFGAAVAVAVHFSLNAIIKAWKKRQWKKKGGVTENPQQ